MNNLMKNYVGQTLTHEEMQDIPYPMMELMVHITAKTWQAGAVLGTALGGIAAIAKPSTRNVVGIQNTIARFGRNGLVSGLFVGPALTVVFVKAKNIDQEGLYDRSFRLRHNQGQLRVDRFADIGLVVGVGACLAAKTNPWLGAAVGTTCGVLTAAVMNNK